MIATSQFTISVVNDGATGATGPQGTSVSNVTPEYRLSDSSTELTGSGTGYSWSPTKPDIPSGKYLWTRNANTLSNGTTVYSDAVCDVVTSGLVFDVDRNSSAITSKVWQSDITTSINTYDGSTAQAIRDRVTQTETDITGITSRVSAVESTTDSLGTRMTTAESSITQNADNIALMVSVDGTTSSLTLTQDMLSAMTSQFVIKDPAGSQTIISGGKISANSITTAMLATDAIKSSNYQASPNAQSPYSAVGTFLDLSTGSLYMPQFGVDGTTGAAYFNGQVNADSGKFGDDNSYWNIETVIDYNATSHAALVGAGNPYLQTGNWQISDNAVATRKYVSTSETAGTASYYKDTGTNTFYDVGMKIPTSFTVGNDSNEDRYHRAFFYQRRYTGSTAPAQDSGWNYPFIIDNEGRVYCTDLIIIGGGTGTTYLPLAGGTITGNLAVTGSTTLNGSVSTTLQIRTNLASTSAATFTGAASAIVAPGVTGKLGVGNGGTGKDSWTANGIVYASASNTLSQLGVGTSGQILKSNGNAAPGWVNQSTIAAGSATNDSDGNAINTTYRKLANNAFDAITATDVSTGNLVVTGSATFTSGLSGDLTGNADTASAIESNRAFTVGITTKNVDWSSAVSFSKADISADATQSANGWMSIDDKKKLDGIATGAQVNSITGVKGNSENSYRTGQVNITAANIGLGNLTNNKQIKGLASGTTSGHFVSWGSDGYTVADSGYTAGQVVKSLASDNDGKIVLTYLDGTTSDPIEVKIIGSSGSSVSYADALNVNGTAIGSTTQPVYIDNQGKPQVTNKIPKLNGASSDGSFYAPTAAGTSGYVLKSNGSGAPSWAAQSTLSVGSATKATQDSDGNAINSTYLKLAGGTMTGDLMLQKTTSIADNLPAKLTFSVIQTDNNKTTSSGYIAVYDDHDNATSGVNMVIRSAGNMYIGGGESPSALYSAIGTNSTAENMYVTADSYIYLEANANTVANRKGLVINNSHELIPVLAEATTNNVGSIGTETYKWANVYATTLHGELDGNAATATKATQDSDGSVINTTYAKLSGAQFSDAVTGTSFGASSYLAANTGNSGTAGGLALYNTDPTKYGIAMRNVSNGGAHGFVQGDSSWGTYFYMNGSSSSNYQTRGWVWKSVYNSTNIASISCEGHAVFNGSVTVGGNAANTSGCKMVFNTTTQSLDFVFN